MRIDTNHFSSLISTSVCTCVYMCNSTRVYVYKSAYVNMYYKYTSVRHKYKCTTFAHIYYVYNMYTCTLHVYLNNKSTCVQHVYGYTTSVLHVYHVYTCTTCVHVYDICRCVHVYNIRTIYALLGSSYKKNHFWLLTVLRTPDKLALNLSLEGKLAICKPKNVYVSYYYYYYVGT